jgi:hypothetical protein
MHAGWWASKKQTEEKEKKEKKRRATSPPSLLPSLPRSQSSIAKNMHHLPRLPSPPQSLPPSSSLLVHCIFVVVLCFLTKNQLCYFLFFFYLSYSPTFSSLRWRSFFCTLLSLLFRFLFPHCLNCFFPSRFFFFFFFFFPLTLLG